MLFLIDYENIGNAGMAGSDCLNEEDHVVIFYSEARKHIEYRTLENITASGCTLCIRKECG